MKTIFALTLLCIITSFAIGEDYKPNPVVSFYDNELMKFNYTPSSGGLSIGYQGNSYPITFGVNPIVYDQLSSDPKVKPLVEGFVLNEKIGYVLAIGGELAFIGGMAVYYNAVKSANDSSTYGNTVSPDMTGLYVALGGLLVTVIGPIFIGQAYGDMSSAVNEYNRDKLQTFSN